MGTIDLLPMLLKQCIAVIELGVARGGFEKFLEVLNSLKFDSYWLSGTTH